VTPLRAVVVDDEEPARARVLRLLRAEPSVEVVGEASDVAGAVALIDRERPDVCFLDVQMPGGTGFDVLERAQHKPRVVFTTAYEQYAVRAFEVHSVDYLLKPFRRDRFAEALTRLRERRSGAEEDGRLAALRAELHKPAEVAAAVDALERIPARKGTRIVLLDPAEIVWFEAEETLVFARTDEGRFLVDRPLADLEARLAPAFFRAHRRFLVRLDRVAEIRPQDGGTCRMTLRDAAGSSLPLSRRQARRLRARLAW